MPLKHWEDVIQERDDDQPSDWEREAARRALVAPPALFPDGWMVRLFELLRRWRPW